MDMCPSKNQIAYRVRARVARVFIASQVLSFTQCEFIHSSNALGQSKEEEMSGNNSGHKTNQNLLKCVQRRRSEKKKPQD